MPQILRILRKTQNLTKNSQNLPQKSRFFTAYLFCIMIYQREISRC
ncbi:hypothetical protein [Helicobacter sp. 23-1045]